MTRHEDDQNNEHANEPAKNVADEHALIQEQIESYLAGALSPDEAVILESHVKECGQCAAALASARALSERLAALFEDAVPAADFEERIIGRLRAEGGAASRSAGGDRSRLGRLSRSIFVPRRIHPAVRKAALATAAVVMIGTVGYVANSMLTVHHGDDSSYQVFAEEGVSKRDSSIEKSDTSAVLRDPRKAYIGGLEREHAALPALDTLDGSVRDSATERGRWDLKKQLNTPIRNGSPEPIEAMERIKREQAVERAKFLAHAKEAEHREPVTGLLPAQNNSSRLYADARPGERVIRNVHTLSLGDDAMKAAPKLADTGYGEVKGATNVDYQSRVYKVPPAFKPTDLAKGVQADRERSDLSELSAVDANKKAAGEEAQGFSGGYSKDGARDAQIAKERELADALPAGAGSGEPKAAQNAGVVAPITQPGAGQQKIIRTGEMQFEVERFDAAVETISKIVGEEGGFVGSTSSDKLANGKVRGFITIRVAPERLDTVVLKLRGIGDLKSQKINSQDITRQYTDLESGLRAARAMEDRLLEIIKTGKGEVKDLLEAEKQLGVWRERIEQLEGEIRYDNNQVALSTLQLTVEEKDIRSPAYATTQEQVTMALETADVETAYNKARDAILAAKGRIIQSELKQFEAGQFGATIGAELLPDAADALIGRLKQLDGRVANFQRTTTVANHGPEGNGVDASALVDVARQKFDNVKIALTMYNLTNVAPRRSVTLSVAAADVDETYRKLLETAGSLGVRIVASNIDHPRANQTSANLTLQAPAAKADAMLAAFRAAGEVVRSETTDNPDTNNVTDAKRGFQVQIFSLAAAAARHTEQMQLAVADVPAVYADLLAQLKTAEARLVVSQLDQKDLENITGIIEFETTRSIYETLRPAISKAGDVLTREVGTAQDMQNTVDSKIHVSLSLLSAASQPVRQTTTLGIETSDVPKATSDWISAVEQAGGHVTGPTEIAHDHQGTAVSRVEIVVPLSQASALLEQARKLGNISSLQTDVDVHVSEGKLARAKIGLTLANSAATLGGSQSTAEAVREAASMSGAALRWCLKILVLGVFFVAPVAVVVVIVWKLTRRLTRAKTARITA